jgi:hypothetical protein
MVPRLTRQSADGGRLSLPAEPNQEGIFLGITLLSTAERPGVMVTRTTQPTDQRGGG